MRWRTAIVLLNEIDTNICWDIPLKIKAELRDKNFSAQGLETFFQDRREKNST